MPSTKTFDPQFVVSTKVVPGRNSDGEVLTLTIPLGPFLEVVVVAPIPNEGRDHGIAYIKSKVRTSPCQQWTLRDPRSNRADGLPDERDEQRADAVPAADDGGKDT